ncbi:MAG: hypothetical protein ABL921_01290 [Pirellula sp.]
MVRIPSYRLHKPSGKAVVNLAGKDIYLGVHGSKESRKLYNRLIAEYLASDGMLNSADQDSITVSEVLAAFLDPDSRCIRANNSVRHRSDSIASGSSERSASAKWRVGPCQRNLPARIQHS